MEIVKKDISWLLQRVPDFNDFYNKYKNLFVNGYVAGGFLRKAILHGSVKTVIEKMQKDSLSGDIDFFYHNRESAKEAYGMFLKSYKKPTSNPCGEIPLLVENSPTGFAFEGRLLTFDQDDWAGLKFQFISKNVGSPEVVLDRFDISNCKIATDGNSVWLMDDWEELEKNKHIRIDNYAGAYLLTRIKKYLSKDYDIYPPQKQELVLKMLEAIDKTKPIKTKVWTMYPPMDAVYQVRGILDRGKSFLTPEEVLIFYGLLGTIYGRDYSGSSLDPYVEEDFAIHMSRKRIKNQNVAENDKPVS
jgi:hypothetical protein